MSTRKTPETEAAATAGVEVPYVPHTTGDVTAMLDAIGVQSIDDLFLQVPERLRSQAALDLPGPLPEPHVRARISALANENRTCGAISFLGAGYYRHWAPEAADALLLRGEFATAYTPYQPEVSQGTLQAIFEFQSLVTMLFDLDVANASMYDGASALAEAALMARRIRPGRPRVLVSDAVHPHYRAAVEAYTQGSDLRIERVPVGADGRTDFGSTALGSDTACLVVGYPNAFGILEDVSAAAKLAREHDALLVTATPEPLSLALCKPPGALGADIAVGEGQSFGLPLSFGGPGAGLFATRDRFVRHMPGRVVGATVDSEGQRGYVLTLATREQHIRRERATSNICTNQTLCTIGITIYLSLLGKRGLRDLADLNYRRAHRVAERLTRAGARLRFSGTFFNEFVVVLPDARRRWEDGVKAGVLAGLPLGDWYPELEDCLLVNVTEVPSDQEIDRLAAVLA